jgi:hypothetical protein
MRHRFSQDFIEYVKEVLENTLHPAYTDISNNFVLDNGEIRAIINEQTGEEIDVLEV